MRQRSYLDAAAFSVACQHVASDGNEFLDESLFILRWA